MKFKSFDAVIFYYSWQHTWKCQFFVDYEIDDIITSKCNPRYCVGNTPVTCWCPSNGWIIKRPWCVFVVCLKNCCTKTCIKGELTHYDASVTSFSDMMALYIWSSLYKMDSVFQRFWQSSWRPSYEHALWVSKTNKTIRSSNVKGQYGDSIAVHCWVECFLGAKAERKVITFPFQRERKTVIASLSLPCHIIYDILCSVHRLVARSLYSENCP